MKETLKQFDHSPEMKYNSITLSVMTIKIYRFKKNIELTL